MDCKIVTCTKQKTRETKYCLTHLQRWRRFRTYGFTEEHFQDLQAVETCELCGEFQPKVMNTDHDHNCCPSGKFCPKCVRGMVCTGCNNMLAQVDAYWNQMETAMQYVMKYKTERGDFTHRIEPRKERTQITNMAFENYGESNKPSIRQWQPNNGT